VKIPKIIFLIVLFMVGIGLPGAAFSAETEKEFGKIIKMKEKELTSRAKEALGKTYPAEKWEQYKFPKYVYTSEAVLAGYKIAVKAPQLLAKFPCYCFCDDMGHKNLAYCFLEKGVAEGKFDDHASTCNICYTQAMRALLWNELGATDAEMLKAMQEAYEK
jgi:hypothetical protein